MKFKYNNNPEQVQEAINVWKTTDISWKQLATKFGIKMSTLKYHYYENETKPIKVTKPVEVRKTKPAQIEKIKPTLIKSKKIKHPGHPMYKHVTPFSEQEIAQLEQPKKKEPKRFNPDEFVDPKTGKILV